MKISNPHIITEGSVQFELEPHGRYIEYDFEKILIYLDVKGQITVWKRNLKSTKEGREILFKLCNYQIKDWTTCKKVGD